MYILIEAYYKHGEYRVETINSDKEMLKLCLKNLHENKRVEFSSGDDEEDDYDEEEEQQDNEMDTTEAKTEIKEEVEDHSVQVPQENNNYNDSSNTKKESPPQLLFQEEPAIDQVLLSGLIKSLVKDGRRIVLKQRGWGHVYVMKMNGQLEKTWGNNTLY